MAPKALAELASGQRVALVSATNGKTTTTRFLAAAVARIGAPVVSNATGANLTSGIAPILASAQSPGLGVLEVDERVLPRVVDPLGAELLVLGNLSRDQLDRYGEVHAVGDLWRNVAETHPDLRVVANASDPHVVWAATPAKTTWVELGLGWRNDAATCPNCAALLRWSTDRFDCPSCGFGQPATATRSCSTGRACHCGSRCRAAGTSPTPRWRSPRRRRTSASIRARRPRRRRPSPRSRAGT